MSEECSYQKNRKYILKYARTKVQCECGVEVNKPCLPGHRKTKKHAKLMFEKEHNPNVILDDIGEELKQLENNLASIQNKIIAFKEANKNIS